MEVSEKLLRAKPTESCLVGTCPGLCWPGEDFCRAHWRGMPEPYKTECKEAKTKRATTRTRVLIRAAHAIMVLEQKASDGC